MKKSIMVEVEMHGGELASNDTYGKILIYSQEGTAIDELVARTSNMSHEQKIVNEIIYGKYDVFIDVGAEFGYFTRIASKHCKQVLSFEAHPVRYGMLLWNTDDLDNVRVFHSFVNNGVTIPQTSERFWEMVSHPKRSEIGDVQFITVNHNVTNIMLDDLNIIYDQKVLIKIDVEGNELDVLGGAIETLKKDNVTWIIELHPDVIDETDLMEIMKNKKYNMLQDIVCSKYFKFYS